LLRAIAHIAFAVFLMFDQSDFGQLTEARVAELRDYRKLIVNAQSSLGARGFSDIQLQRQQKIINDSLTLLDATIQNRQVQKAALENFARRMSWALTWLTEARALRFLENSCVCTVICCRMRQEFNRKHSVKV